MIPEICRQGGITKRDIGAIRIFDDETKFEIDADAAQAFAANVAKVKKGDIFIGQTEAPADGGHVRRTPPDKARSHQAGKKDWKSSPTSGHDDKASKSPREKPRWTAKAKAHGGKPYEGNRHDGKPHGNAGFGGKRNDGKHSGKPGGFQKRPKPR